MFRVEGSFPPPSFLLPPLSLPDIVSFLTDLYLEQILTGEIPISPFREFILYGRPSAVTPSSHQPFQSRNTYGLKDLKQQRERVGGGVNIKINTYVGVVASQYIPTTISGRFSEYKQDWQGAAGNT